jgi:dihydroneopterin aldolase
VAAIPEGTLTVTIELQGIELHGFHGVLEDERRDGQRFLVDLELDLGDETAARSDAIADAVDYRDVVATVVEISDRRAYQLLEAFATAIAEALLERFPLARARVRVRKPDVVLARPVDHAAVVVERRRPSL